MKIVRQEISVVLTPAGEDVFLFLGEYKIALNLDEAKQLSGELGSALIAAKRKSSAAADASFLGTSDPRRDIVAAFQTQRAQP
jgi:hypothetical protein